MAKILPSLFIAILLVITAACTKEPTSYDTQTIFVADGWPFDKSEFERLMADGWEIMHERRAYGRPSSAEYSPETWGYEYGLRKPTYD